jgi:hypothetical protein
MTTLREALSKINDLACFATEEDPTQAAAALLAIGEIARAALAAQPAASVALPEPDFWLDGGKTPCFYESSIRAALAAQTAQPVQEPVAWRYWKDKFGCWEYSDTKLEFPAVPAGTTMHPLVEPHAAALAEQSAQEAHRVDAERWRMFLSTRPPETHEAICSAIDAARSKP